MRTNRVALALIALLALSFAGGADAKTKAKPKPAAKAKPKGKAAGSRPTIAEQQERLGPGDPNAARQRVLVGPGDEVRGPDDALVTVIAFYDFGASYVKAMTDLPYTLTAGSGAKVRVVFKHLPMARGGDFASALLAHTAAAAAGEQGKFWEYAAILFANRDKLSRAALEQYADSLGLDVTKFKDALDTKRFDAQIQADVAYAGELGFTGPTLFVNGWSHGMNGAVDVADAVKEELTATEALLKKHKKLARKDVYAELMKNARVGPDPLKAAQRPQRPSGPDPAKVYAVPLGTAPAKGGARAKLTVIVFGEFKCPFCQRVLKTLGELETKYGTENIRFVFRHYIVHATARDLARAAAAAGEQGKFWAMHDLLFQDISKTDPTKIDDYAAQIGLDMAQFRDALDQKRADAIVDADIALGNQFGVRGTPAFFINGRYLSGAQPLDRFVAVCDVELARAELLLEKGAAADRLYDELILNGELKVANAGGGGGAGGGGAAQIDKTVYAVPVGTAPVRGAAAAKLTVVMFTEFKCPYCQRVQATMAELTKKYGADIRFVHKSYVVHGEPAKVLHRAAAAAGEQGKFWEMHDALFADYPNVDDAKLLAIAKRLNLDVKAWQLSMADKRWDAEMDADLKQGSAIGVRGVPAIFVNGRKVSGAQPLSVFVTLCDEELKKADEAVKAGTAAADYYDTVVKGGVAASP